jgi:hypothetical protein
MGNAREREGEKGGSHRADGREKDWFNGAICLPIGGQNGRPIGSLFQSEERTESIHFAPPLTWRVSYGAKLGRIRRRRPMNSRESVMRFRNNELAGRCLKPIFRSFEWFPGCRRRLYIVTPLHLDEG